jgi:la-related protein 1
MDSQGFVSLAVIADFNRIKQLTQDVDLLRFVCQQSHNLEVRSCVDGQSRVRKREGWEKWVLELSKRNASAQHEGVEEIRSTVPPEPRVLRQIGGSLPLSPTVAGIGAMQPANGFAPLPLEAVLGEQPPTADFGGFRVASPIGMAEPISMLGSPDSLQGFSAKPANLATNGAADGEGDAFSDAQAEILNLMVRKQEVTSPGSQHSSLHHDMPNGSLGEDEAEGSSNRASSGPNGHTSSRE